MPSSLREESGKLLLRQRLARYRPPRGGHLTIASGLDALQLDVSLPLNYDHTIICAPGHLGCVGRTGRASANSRSMKP